MEQCFDLLGLDSSLDSAVVANTDENLPASRVEKGADGGTQRLQRDASFLEFEPLGFTGCDHVHDGVGCFHGQGVGGLR